MKFQVLPTISLFLAATQAAPMSLNPGATTSLEPRQQQNLCGNSSFENKTSGGSPRVSDCEQIVRNIAGGGAWATPAWLQHRRILSYGTCAFGIELQGPDTQRRIGNTDVQDLIRDSIARFQWNGLVGARGQADCSGAGVIWGIYHT